MIAEGIPQEAALVDTANKVRRWFGGCISVQYLQPRVLTDHGEASLVLMRVELVSPYHDEVSFVGEGWKQLVLSRRLDIGFFMPDNGLIECRLVYAIKHESTVELLCLDSAEHGPSNDPVKPCMMILADGEHVIFRIPVVEM